MTLHGPYTRKLPQISFRPQIADGTDFIKADLYFLFLNTNHSNRTNLCSIVGGSFRITFTDVKPLQPDNA